MHKDTVIELRQGDIRRGSSIILPFFEGNVLLTGAAKKADELSNGAVSKVLKEFKAEKNELKMIMPAGKLNAVLLLGLGKKDARLDVMMDAFANAAKAMRNAGLKEAALVLDGVAAERKVYAAVLGASLGLHRFMKYKTKGMEKVKNLVKLEIMVEHPDNHAAEFKEALLVSAAMKNTRDMVNTPPNDADTESVASYAKKIARDNKLKFTLLDEKKLRHMKMGCILAVGRGSTSRPCIAIVEYNGAGKERPILLVGKGITFDSGGYNLKPATYISNMKDDKAGAVTVLHVMEAVSTLKLKVNLVGIIALAENLVSGEAFRPDDILKAYNGMTVEITNTDAEGRLVLADALAYGVEKYAPAGVVDIATLTGASLYALGYFTTPIVGNDDASIENVKKAADVAGEKVWQLPAWEEYGEAMKSDIADLKNATDGPDAGVITGAMFLKNFVGDTPWVHLDIGTTVWSKTENGMKQKGATAVGVRTLIELIKIYSKR
jgi:leucyl aminopeptidase